MPEDILPRLCMKPHSSEKKKAETAVTEQNRGRTAAILAAERFLHSEGTHGTA
jgi:hypothetical protein